MADPVYPQLGIVIPAGGASVRFGANKLVADLAGVSVLERSIRAFIGIARQIVVAIATPLETSAELSAIAKSLEAESSVRFVVAAGATRAHTVRNALDSIETEWVGIHDGARPLVSRAVIDRVVAAAMQVGAAAPAMPVALTIKRAATKLPAPVEATVPRNTLWAMQTPQVMRRQELLEAYAKCPIPLDQVTDDVQLLELCGKRVMLVEGEERNLKLTTQLDLRIAQILLEP